VLLYFQKKREVIEPTGAMIDEKKAKLVDEEMVLASEMERVRVFTLVREASVASCGVGVGRLGTHLLCKNVDHHLLVAEFE
jgi:hypothetical protein